jgi:hypothetical protein
MRDGRAKVSRAVGDEGFGGLGHRAARGQQDGGHEVSLDCASSGNDEGNG